MAKTLLILIIAFVTLEFVVSSVLSWLNTRWMTHPVPPELEGLYDDEKYRKQQEYMRTNKRVSLTSRCVSFVLTLLILGFGLLGWLDNQCKTWTDIPVVQVILFLVIFNLFNTLISLPFSYYSTFVIEERFGFNRTTHKTFWLDTLKSFAVSTDWNNWTELASGEFSNIVNNPIWQSLSFPTTKVRVIKFVADRLASGERMGFDDVEVVMAE